MLINCRLYKKLYFWVFNRPFLKELKDHLPKRFKLQFMPLKQVQAQFQYSSIQTNSFLCRLQHFNNLLAMLVGK